MYKVFKVEEGDVTLIATECYTPEDFLELTEFDGLNSVVVIAETEEEALRGATLYDKHELGFDTEFFNGIEIAAIDCRYVGCFFTADIVEKAREKYKAFYGEDSVPQQFNVAYSKSKGWSCEFCADKGDCSSGFTTWCSGDYAVKVWNGRINMCNIDWNDDFSDE